MGFYIKFDKTELYIPLHMLRSNSLKFPNNFKYIFLRIVFFISSVRIDSDKNAALWVYSGFKVPIYVYPVCEWLMHIK